MSPAPPPRIPQLRERVVYKKPSRINSVSLTMLGIMGLIGYFAYCMWPGFSLKSNVKSAMRDPLMELYKLNLRGYADSQRRLFKLEKDLYATAVKLGVTDPELKFTIYKDKKIVYIEASFTTVVELEGIGKSFKWHHSPRVETDAERIEW